MLSVSEQTGPLVRADGSSRGAILPGALVVFAAVIGADFAISAATYQRMHTTAAVAVRAAVPSISPVLGHVDDVAWLAALLMIACLLRCASSCVSSDVAVNPIGSIRQCVAASILRRKISLSFRHGGLYGP